MTVTNLGLPSIHRGDRAEARDLLLLARPTRARSGAPEHHHVAATDYPLRGALVHPTQTRPDRRLSRPCEIGRRGTVGRPSEGTMTGRIGSESRCVSTPIGHWDGSYSRQLGHVTLQG